MNISIEILLLGISVLFFISIIVGKMGDKFGIPALLLFLILGMAMGTDGLGIQFDNAGVARDIGLVALAIILFTGGMNTNIAEIRPVLLPGLSLSTLGVILTTLITGFIIWWISGMSVNTAEISLASALLLAATLSSTDSASVFSILRSKDLRLKHNLRPLLEFESGCNDPVAYILTITVSGIILLGTKTNFLVIALSIGSQLVIGAIVGFLCGKLALLAINRLQVSNSSFYSFLVLTFAIFIFSSSHFLKGNGLLAVYIGGLVIGNAKFIHKRRVYAFFDGISWMGQLIMFLTLGLLINPHELIPIIVPGLIISLIMVVISRPLSVFACLAPFRKMQLRDRMFVSWVGLRGAVPIIFAILPLAAGVPHARIIFNIVFFCTLVSLLVHGTSLPLVARWLGLIEEPGRLRRATTFGIRFHDDVKSVTAEVTINSGALNKGNRLMDLPLPEKTLVVMVKRNNSYFIPTGQTVLIEGDVLLIITDNYRALSETYQTLGIVEDSE